MSKINKNILDEAIDVNGSKVFVENGEVRTVLREGLEDDDYMPLREAMALNAAEVKKFCELHGIFNRN